MSEVMTIKQMPAEKTEYINFFEVGAVIDAGNICGRLGLARHKVDLLEFNAKLKTAEAVFAKARKLMAKPLSSK